MIRPRNVRRVARRHLRELFRDRRTILVLLLVPAVVVLIFTVSRDELLEEFGEQAQTFPKVALQGGRDGSALVTFLQEAGFELVLAASVEDALRAERAPVGLVIPDHFDRDAQAARGRLTVVVRGSSFEERLAHGSLSAALERYQTRLVRERLRRSGVAARHAEPLQVTTTNVSSSEERTGGLVAEFLPFMIFAQIVGMMTGTATDVTVGEKERRTVEALLVTPMSRREIVAGKWLVVVTMGAIAAAVTLAAGIMSFRFATAEAIELASGASILPAGAYARTVIGVLAFVALMASLQILVGFFARSQQQAGIMFSPLFFLAVFPLIFFQGQSGASLGASLYAVPGLGATLLARNGLAGTATAAAPAITLVSHLAYSAVVLVLADRLFHSERALLRATG